VVTLYLVAFVNTITLYITKVKTLQFYSSKCSLNCRLQNHLLNFCTTTGNKSSQKLAQETATNGFKLQLTHNFGVEPSADIYISKVSKLASFQPKMAKF